MMSRNALRVFRVTSTFFSISLKIILGKPKNIYALIPNKIHQAILAFGRKPIFQSKKNTNLVPKKEFGLYIYHAF